MKSTFIAFENMTFDQTIQNKDLVIVDTKLYKTKTW